LGKTPLQVESEVVFDPTLNETTFKDSEDQYQSSTRRGFTTIANHGDGTSSKTVTDAMGRPVLAGLSSDRLDEMTRYERDFTGQLKSVDQPGLGKIDLAMSGFGTPAMVKDLDGKLNLKTFDEAGDVVAFQEDSTGRQRKTETMETEQGRVQWLIRGEQATATRLDAAGRPVEKRIFYDGSFDTSDFSVGHASGEEFYTYHDHGRVATYRRKDGSLLSYEYDDQRRLVAITCDGRSRNKK
jgi:YD repeat-containing protein